jgi:hypothetical protein
MTRRKRSDNHKLDSLKSELSNEPAVANENEDKTEDKENNSSQKPTIYTVLATVTGSLALIVSITSAYYSYRSHADTAGSQLISETYSTFYDLNKKQGENSDLSHMFVAPEDYPATAQLVKESAGEITSQKRAEYQLKEKAIAFYILTVFEQTFYQYQHAKNVGDTERAEFLRAVLDYFTGRLLRNPRLLFYWDKNGGNVSQYYEAETKKYYEEKVLHDPSAPLTVGPDNVGPYVVKVAP